MDEIILSICIPTYNRGHRALELVNQLKDLLDFYDNIEIIISNNGSTKHTEGYDMIEDMHIDRLRYHKFNENQFFWGNVNQVLKMSKGKFAMLLSDEDYPVKENISHYMELCNQYDAVSVIRSNTSVMYSWMNDDYGKKGLDAIKKFYMVNNYMSGVIYNRTILTNAVIDRLYGEFCDNVAYRYYPHMVFDGYCVLNGDYICDGLRLIEEGKEEEELAEETDKDQDMAIFQYATYESRLAQQRGFVDVIKKLWCGTEAQKAQMFMKICEKTIFLLCLVRDQYVSKGVDFTVILNKYREQCMEDIEYMALPVIHENMDVWKEYIELLIAQGGE